MHHQPPITPTSSFIKFEKLALKKIDCSKEAPRGKLLEVCFGKLQAPLNRINEIKDGFLAFSEDPTVLDELTTERAIKALKEINLKPSIPPQIQAKKTLFIRQIDITVGERSENEIMNEIKRNHPTLKIEKVIKIPNRTHFFKLLCKDIPTAEKVLQDGLLMFHTKISIAQVTQENFVHMQICFKCYQYEDHTTRNCKSHLKICSECAEEGHTHNECNSNEKHCINCRRNGMDDNHRTLAAKCPHRKQTIKEKEERLRQPTINQNITYAQAAQQLPVTSQTTNTTTQPQINLANNTHKKMALLVIEAHIASMTTNEPYGQILTKSVKANFDFDAVFPDDRNSARLFDIINNPQATNEQVLTALDSEVEDFAEMEQGEEHDIN